MLKEEIYLLEKIIQIRTSQIKKNEEKLSGADWNNATKQRCQKLKI